MRQKLFTAKFKFIKRNHRKVLHLFKKALEVFPDTSKGIFSSTDFLKDIFSNLFLCKNVHRHPRNMESMLFFTLQHSDWNAGIQGERREHLPNGRQASDELYLHQSHDVWNGLKGCGCETITLFRTNSYLSSSERLFGCSSRMGWNRPCNHACCPCVAHRNRWRHLFLFGRQERNSYSLEYVFAMFFTPGSPWCKSSYRV